MAEIIGITSVASPNIKSLFASDRDNDFMSVDITLGYPTAYTSRGTLLAKKTSDGYYYDYDSTKSDGRENLVGVLAEDLASLGALQPTNIIVSGDINRAACSSIGTIPTGPTATANGNSINFVNEN